ncbi:LssY C-terminal domain-containing protein [Sinomonas sp. ASV486]|uniref:LssY C-terminal domain-containing protein n=1 Tax=Sinomonas sp. ASV486 TaxID=3051170 RepID=UPI0027DEA4A1|nr:LssY C-terminal domain-containing protein [Sinomonas sp. ASV486]MDQ4490024.1 LssY C-terminal domain-containing protein [Sinomonas sp. ASV486]
MASEEGTDGVRIANAPTHRRASVHLLVALLALALIVAGFYAVRTLTIFVSPMLFLAAVFLEAVAVTVFVFAVVRALTLPGKVLRSLGRSAWEGLASNAYVVRVRTSETAWVGWLRGRFRRDSPAGIWLTGTVAIAAWPLMSFLGVAFTVATGGALTRVDERIANLMPAVRTPGETVFFTAATMLVNWQALTFLTVAAAAMLWWERQRFLAVVVVGAVVGQELLATVVKLLFGRHRPDASLALLDVGTLGFPSGHAVRVTVVYGLLAYLLVKAYRTTVARTLVVAGYLVVVLLVAMSRVYLGVHFVSDVWGGVLLGAAFLTAVVGFLEIAARFPIVRHERRAGSAGRAFAVVPAIGIVFAVVTAPLLIHPHEHPGEPTTQQLPALDAASFSRLPLYSETLTGDHMEPANFIFVGTEDQLVGAFEGAGWARADRSTFANTLQAFAVGIQGGQYASAPVTPAFMAGEPETVAFQKATASNSLRQRHHTRIWRTDYAAPDGRPIWEATASFDDGIEFAGAAKVPTHHIDPNIDVERAFIIGTLGYPERLVPLTHPQMGHNGSGDEFFTDGKAQLVVLR